MQSTTLTCVTSVAPFVAPRKPAARRRTVQARGADTKTENTASVAEQSIDGLDRTYCDDFVCTSSPSVEASVRQLAKDLQRANGRWTPIFASNVQYQDSFRKFKGPEGYQRLDFVPSSVQQASVTVTSMRMLDNSSAEIQWQLTGKVGVFPVDVAGTTEIRMNLLTGRIEQHRESWNLRGCSPPAALAWTAARALWSAQQASSDAGRTAGQVLDSLTSMDDDEQYTPPNPNDPMKFFSQKDTFKQDAALFVGVVALFWFLVQGWAKLFSGGSGMGGPF